MPPFVPSVLIFHHFFSFSSSPTDVPCLVSSNCDISEFAPSATELDCLLNRLYVIRVQCPILKPEQRWDDLSEDEKNDVRRQFNLTEEDEFWRSPVQRSQIVCDGPPSTITGKCKYGTRARAKYMIRQG